MPNKPKTPNHSIRSPEEIWGPGDAKAKRLGLTMTDAVNNLIVAWTKRPLTKAEKVMEADNANRRP